LVGYEATIFTGLNPIGSAISVICCVVVKNAKPLSVDDVVKKYAVDPWFVEQIRGVTGIKYMYEAELAEKPFKMSISEPSRSVTMIRPTCLRSQPQWSGRNWKRGKGSIIPLLRARTKCP
jgi:hypothetical protein